MSISAVSAGELYAVKNNKEIKEVKKENVSNSVFEETKTTKTTIVADGKDDGKISFFTKLKNMAKGIVKPFKEMFSSPKNALISLGTIGAIVGATTLTVATCGIGLPALAVLVGVTAAAAGTGYLTNSPAMKQAALAGLIMGSVTATGGAITPFLCSTGAVVGTGTLGYGIYKSAMAETDKEEEEAWQAIGLGAFALATSALSASSALKAAQKAGVKTSVDASELHWLKDSPKALYHCFKSTPASLEHSSKLALGLVALPVVSKIPADSIQMVSKPNKAESYLVNGADDIVYQGTDGKLYVPNKWNPEAPYEVSKGSIIMIYDKAGKDFAVCDPKIFGKTYVGTDGNYVNVAKLKPGEIISATKQQAKGGFEIVPEGTAVKTLEGNVTVKAGQVKMYDVDGNPYVGDISKSLLKRNVPTEGNSQAAKAFEILNQFGEKAKTATQEELSILHEQLVNIFKK